MQDEPLEQYLADSLGASVRATVGGFALPQVVAVPGGEGGGATGTAGTRSAGGDGDGGSYPRSTDTLGSEQVRVSKWTYPDGGSEGHLLKYNPLRCVQSNPISHSPNLLPSLADFSSACGFCAAVQHWIERREENATRSLRRSAISVRRTVRSNNLARLMTFTNGAHGSIGWAHRKAALDDVARFLKVHGVECFGTYRALLVAEQGGKGGRWHVHAVVPKGGFLPYSQIIRRWSSFMERRGWSSKTGTHRWHVGDEQGKHKGGFTSARVAGRYVAKYLTKDLGLQDYGSHVHRYRTVGTDTPLPVVTNYAGFTDALSDLVGLHLEPIERPNPDGEPVLVGYWFGAG